MKTGCKSCGSVQEHRLNHEATKIICESCDAEITSTEQLRAVLKKKNLVRPETPPSAIVPLTSDEIDEARLVGGQRPKRMAAPTSTRVSARAEDLRSGVRTTARADVQQVDVYDQKSPNVTAMRRDATAPVVERPNTPRAQKMRADAEAKAAVIRSRLANSKEVVRKVRENVRDITFQDTLAESGVDSSVAESLLDLALDDD
jgi:hypothetical protein